MDGKGGIAQPNDAHGELARANLLRLRGDARGAEEIALSLLKQDPDNVEAHIFLGDLHTELGDIRQAIEWYELSLDLDPRSAEIERRLAELRAKRDEAQRRESVESLGLPPERDHTRPLALALLGTVAMIGLGAWLFGRSRPAPKPNGIEVSQGMNLRPAPVETPPKTEDKPIVTPRPDPSPAPTTPESPDEALLAFIRSRSGEGGRLTGAVLDPRSKHLTLSYSYGDVDDRRRIGATVARDALVAQGDVLFVSVRGIVQGQVAYMADVSRERYTETLQPGWTEARGVDAWIDHLLTNEWPAKASQSDLNTPPPRLGDTEGPPPGATQPVSSGTGQTNPTPPSNGTP